MSVFPVMTCSWLDHKVKFAVVVTMCFTSLATVFVFQSKSTFISLQHHIMELPTECAPVLVDTSKLVSSRSVPASLSDWGTVMVQRRLHLLQACRALSLQRKPLTKMEALYAQKLQLVYCPIPKVGCSFWKRVFATMALSLDVSPLELSSLDIHKSVHTLSLNQQPARHYQTALLSSIKFMFTRDPYRRAFSGYCDKLFVFSFETMPIAETIRGSNGRPSSFNGTLDPVTRDWLLNRLNVTFAESLQYSLGFYTHGHDKVDVHFTPSSQICKPCGVHFDFIGKMETFNNDTEFILKFLNQSQILERMGDIEGNNEISIVSDVCKRTFLALKKFGITDEIVLDSVLKRVWKLFKIRGFLNEYQDYPVRSLREYTQLTAQRFTQLSLHALKHSGIREVRKKQRDEYLVRAFRSVPLKILRNFRSAVTHDCVIFDYDCSPPEVFADRKNNGDEEDNVFSNDKYVGYKSVDYEYS
ncbi:carbohydrate sulfotransferase 11 [Aplysia californica]|uniref:Carbohydrate sulfotransferase n=1 Tax=Aplysia californica TaxID=6500 RepID=A0ABM1AEA9_APLCA|nr:carbohydrate sulfotransferase 11 [Aplysia californica]